MTRHFVSIKSQPCKYCQAPIGFIKTKTNKWLVVDVYCLGSDEITYYNNQGLYPLHKCKGR